MLVAVHHLAQALHDLVRAGDGESRREDRLHKSGWSGRALDGRDGGRGKRGRVAVRADERDVVFRVGETLLRRRLLVVRRAVAVHVALANEGALALAVADGGEDLGRRVNRAVPAARGGSDADGSPDDLAVRSSSVGRVGELRDARVSQFAGELQIPSQSSAYLGFCRESDLVEPVEELELLTKGEIKVLGSMRVGIDEAVQAGSAEAATSKVAEQRTRASRTPPSAA